LRGSLNNEDEVGEALCKKACREGAERSLNAVIVKRKKRRKAKKNEARGYILQREGRQGVGEPSRKGKRWVLSVGGGRETSPYRKKRGSIVEPRSRKRRKEKKLRKRRGLPPHAKSPINTETTAKTRPSAIGGCRGVSKKKESISISIGKREKFS